MAKKEDHRNISIVKIKGIGTALKGVHFLFFKAKEMDLKGDQELGNFFVSELKKINTFSKQDEERLREALPGKFKKFVKGEPDEDESDRKVNIKLLGSGRRGYFELEREAMDAVVELDVSGPFAQVRDLDEIAKYGTIPMPALVINGKVVSSGRIVKKEEIKKMILEALQRGDYIED